MPILEVKELRKTFQSVVAVDSISFSVEAGEIFTIIGPNGAGKTTTLEMIEGLQTPDNGDIQLKGLNWKSDSKRIKQMIGVQPQTSALFDLLTVYESLDVFAGFYERSRPIEEILDFINLGDHRKKFVKTLSGGQRQRLAIGIALVNDPDILFLDEPTTGLDPQARRNLWDIILKLKGLGKTTILTTHYMEEAEKLSDRVCIVDQGKIIALDTPQNLIQLLAKEREIHLTFPSSMKEAQNMVQVVKDYPGVTKVHSEQNVLLFSTTSSEESLYQLFKYTTENQIEVRQIGIKDLSLEDVFIAFTGKEWRD
ncbi:ATP-binding cassette domain-containing protein [Cytobacillus depressus]|uniref:ATP-binding cassette domain-containing protein n=1 Tax=Cytobacillus depressus TaxID=1602942 RepID=A0A6L3V6M4_9BACI|nr:ATP-binding cassette domain-containing protein [Cytobacillus depressus]KAB2334857.1 ATP-binding cassette domain-containing protein [Cytobacillus depressus]